MARGDSLDLAVRVDIAAEPAMVWRVLTDYDSMARFVPGVIRSRRVGATKEGPVVEQRGVMGNTFVARPVSSLLQMREVRPHRLEFRALAGDFSTLTGAWALSPAAKGTRLDYRCRLRPRTAVPAPILDLSARTELVPRVRAIAREAERLARAAGEPQRR